MAERFNCTIRDLLRRPVFEEGDSNWVDILPTKRKHYKNRVQTSTKIAPIQASSNKKEGYVYHIILDKRKRIKPICKIQDLVRKADLKKSFSKRDTTK